MGFREYEKEWKEMDLKNIKESMNLYEEWKKLKEYNTENWTRPPSGVFKNKCPCCREKLKYIAVDSLRRTYSCECGYRYAWHKPMEYSDRIGTDCF